MKFIVLEGPDGVGKTTIAQEIISFLNTNTNYNATYVSPLDNEPIGTEIKKMITLAKHAVDGYKQTEIALIISSMVAMIEQHLKDKNENDVVICDRWTLSTYVYQGIAKEQDIQKIQQWIDLIDKMIVPDLVILFDGEDEELDQRIFNRIYRKLIREQGDVAEDELDLLIQKEYDKFEKKEFQTKVRQGYRSPGVHAYFDNTQTKLKTIKVTNDYPQNFNQTLKCVLDELSVPNKE
jgi:dTMP kinase|nr:MAG TPA: TMPK protein [Caudoviricetes sp.]